ncbi:MAG: peptidyl-prolyl cis-trans isomerase, partial [Desulfobacterales bacterium]
ELEVVEPRVRADVIKEKQKAAARAQAEAFLAALKEGKSLADESARLKLPVETTGYFPRQGPLPQIGYSQELLQAAFQLSPENRWPQQVFEVGDGFYVVAFEERQEPSSAEFEKQKADMKQKLREQKQYRAITDWLAELRTSGQVTIDKSYIN